MRRASHGFTLVELLVVIAIIGILMSMLMPAVGVVRENARKTKCAANLRQIMVAITNYEAQKGVYPPGRVGCDSYEYYPCVDRRTGQPDQNYERTSTSGFAMILPELDEGDLFRRMAFQRGAIMPSMEDAGTKGWQTYNSLNTWVLIRPAIYACPSDRGRGYNYWYSSSGRGGLTMAINSYAMCMGWKGPTYANKCTEDVTYRNNGVFIYKICRTSNDVARGDGLGTTIFLGETRDGQGYSPSNCWPVAIRLADSLRCTEQPIYYKWGSSGTYIRENDNKPKDGRYVNGAFNSYHIGGANFAFGDGHVQFLLDDIDLALYRRLGTYDGSYDGSDTGSRPPETE